MMRCLQEKNPTHSLVTTFHFLRSLTVASWLMGVVVSEGSEPIDFDRQIIPLITKLGCNAGSCHGAASGRGNLKLSLFGSEPSSDFYAFVTEYEGRRIDREQPQQSLLLRKPLGELNHGGGKLIEEGDPAHRLIKKWLESSLTRVETGDVHELICYPPRVLSPDANTSTSLQFVAIDDAGRKMDVTELVQLSSRDSATVLIDHERRTVRSSRPGIHTVLARYRNVVLPVEIVVPFAHSETDAGSVDPSVTTESLGGNFIDQEIEKVLQTLRLQAYPPAEDGVFIRRVTLDLIGRLPSRDEYDRYLGDRSTEKKFRLIDQLLHSDEYVEFWTFRWSQWLRIRSIPNEPEVLFAYTSWIREQIVTDRSLKSWIQDLLLATGDSHQVGPAGFARMVDGPRMQAELVSELFLGAKLGCANCHNHPLDRWTQDDYHGLAAIFARMERGRVVQAGTRGEVIHPRTGEAAIPKIPGVRWMTLEEQPLQSFVGWLTEGNRLLPRALVNRAWAAVMEKGLIEPINEMGDSNPSTHSVLLNRLADWMPQQNYSWRAILRKIVSSDAYGRSHLRESDFHLADYFVGRKSRALLPEVLMDAVSDVTQLPDQQLKPYERAISITDQSFHTPTLLILGRCPKIGACDIPSTTGSLVAQLHKLNGGWINDKIAAKEGRLHQMLASSLAPMEIIEDFYRRALSRSPDEDELAYWSEQLRGVSLEERALVLEDIVWSILNSAQFQSIE